MDLKQGFGRGVRRMKVAKCSTMVLAAPFLFLAGAWRRRRLADIMATWLHTASLVWLVDLVAAMGSKHNSKTRFACYLVIVSNSGVLYISEAPCDDVRERQ